MELYCVKKHELMAKSSNHTYDIQKWVNLSTFGKILALGYKSCLTDVDARREGVGSMRTTADKGGGEVKNWQNFADVFYGWPLIWIVDTRESM